MEINREILTEALQSVWDDWAEDTGCYPGCFTVFRGRKLQADFSKEPNFVLQVCDKINYLSKNQPTTHA